ncbi:MAG TPA: transposase [Actinomycetales bacterium]|nr:transposase [Actinomycetales bacterium]
MEDFRTRALVDGPYTFPAADALVMKVREGGRAVPVHANIATGVYNDGHREILELQAASSENGSGWLTYFRDLVARGLTGVKLVTSDAHPGLVEAIGAALPGTAGRGAESTTPPTSMSVTSKTSWPWVKTLLHSALGQPEEDKVHAQFDGVLEALLEKLLAAARTPGGRPGGDPGVQRLPQGDLASDLVKQANEQLNKWIRRHTHVVGSSPDRPSLIRLVGAVLVEQHDEWIEGRRYINLGALAASQGAGTEPESHTETKEVNATDPAALAA